MTGKDFRRLWISFAIATAGTGISLVAFSVYLFDDFGPWAVGSFMAAVAFARLVLLPYGGVLADKKSRVGVIRTGYGLSALGASAIVLIPDRGMGAILLCAILQGAGYALFSPAIRALLPDLVPLDGLERARGRLSATDGLFALIGPAVGGIAVTQLDPRVAIVADAMGFVLAMTVLPSLSPSSAPVRPQDARSGSFRESLRAISRVPWVSFGMAQAAAQILFGFAPSIVLIRIVADERYGSGGLGILLSTSGAAALVGTLVAARWRPRRPGLVANLGFLSYVAVELCIGFSTSLPVFVTAVFLSGIGISFHGVWWYAALSREFPSSMRGRVNSVDEWITGALEPVGMALAVPAVHLIGIEAIGVIGALAFVVAPLGVLAVRGFPGYGQPGRAGKTARVPVTEQRAEQNTAGQNAEEEKVRDH
ncbi:MFS transporter [Streptomyces sp. NPDC056672]|uniref:MFS transporter n=1 Tax=Streptomyces sp. NPDC056672 TaxID=3345906 RepID=UPI0036797678